MMPCCVLDRLVEMRVSVEEYCPFLSELSMFRVYLHATVDETDQLTATFADFRLILPQLDIIVRCFVLLSVCLSVCSVCLSARPSVRPSVCLSVCLYFRAELVMGWVGWRLNCVIFLTSWNTLLSVNEDCSWIITFIDSWLVECRVIKRNIG